MKEQIKMRKQWLINPETQVHKPKQKSRHEGQNLNRYLGSINDEDLEELEDLDDEAESYRR